MQAHYDPDATYNELKNKLPELDLYLPFYLCELLEVFQQS